MLISAKNKLFHLSLYKNVCKYIYQIFVYSFNYRLGILRKTANFCIKRHNQVHFMQKYRILNSLIFGVFSAILTNGRVF